MKINLKDVTMDDLVLTTTTGSKMNPHIGSMFEDWLKKEGIYDKVTKDAKDRVAEWETCAVLRFSRDNPDVTAICISCSCPRCTVTCF